MMLLVPLFLYPLLMLGLSEVMRAGKARLASAELVVALVDDDAAALIGRETPPSHTTFVRMTRPEAEALLKTRKLAALVEAAPGAKEALAAKQQAVLKIGFTRRYDHSIEGKDRVRLLIHSLEVGLLSARLEEVNLPRMFAEPLKTVEEDVDFKSDLGPLIASRILPVVLVVMLFLGAFYPAVDVTAGEKERGTLETLLVAPVRPMEVMLAKYLTIAIIANLATLMNLLTMSLTLGFGLSVNANQRVSMSLGGEQLLMLLLCLVPAAFMVSGLSLVVASLARSFKEAQNLMTPLMMLSLLPAVAGTMPGLELTWTTALVPLLNVVLLVKAVVLGTAHWDLFGVTVASVVACSLVCVKLAANAFASESLRFGGAESWRDLFRIG